MVERIDFSAKHEILILNDDGSVTPMDEPYFRAEKIKEDTWQILSDGDYSYLAAGSDAAISIDTGYGAGNIRFFEETLTKVPVRYAANTHDHFDHTAGNAYFETVYMSEKTYPLATVPYPSFAGITFPKASNVQIVSDGDEINLGERSLRVISMPDHAAGSLLFLDADRRLLFAGDEVQDFKRINGTVKKVYDQLEYLLSFRESFDMICSGPGIFPGELAEQLLTATDLILKGQEGERAGAGHYEAPVIAGLEGRIIYRRRGARPEDLPPDFDIPDPNKRILRYRDVAILYDLRKIYD